MSTPTEDVIDEQATETQLDATVAESRVVAASNLAGASPAVPRDSRLLAAEAAEFDARTAAEEAESARKAAEEAASKAAATLAAAEKSRAELEAARAEAKAKAAAAALQVKLEQEELDEAAAAARAQSRARRDEQLGTVQPVAEAAPVAVAPTRRSTDGPMGSLALFILRLALAGWAGIVGWQSLLDRVAVQDALIKVGLPEANSATLAWGVGIGLIVIAIFLLFGVATRIFALLMLVGVVGFLAYFRFGPFSPFLEGHFGFYGDRDVLLAVISLVLILVGAGGFSLDARVRHRRQAAKAAR